MLSNPDSVWSRSSAARAGAKHKGGNKQQASGADIAKKMKFDKEPHRSIQDKEPLSLMDLVFQAWGVHEPYDDGEDKENESEMNRIVKKLRGQ